MRKFSEEAFKIFGRPKSRNPVYQIIQLAVGSKTRTFIETCFTVCSAATMGELLCAPQPVYYLTIYILHSVPSMFRSGITPRGILCRYYHCYGYGLAGGRFSLPIMQRTAVAHRVSNCRRASCDRLSPRMTRCAAAVRHTMHHDSSYHAMRGDSSSRDVQRQFVT